MIIMPFITYCLSSPHFSNARGDDQASTGVPPQLGEIKPNGICNSSYRYRP